MKVKVLVDQLCLTLCNPMGCPWDSPGKNTGVDCHSLLQGVFPTQGRSLGLPHYRQILYHLSNQGSPTKGFTFSHNLNWQAFLAGIENILLDEASMC